MSDAPVGVGERIAVRRKLSGLTQEQLANRAHVSVSLLRKVEQGSVPASSAFITAVAKALSISVSDLLDLPPQPQNHDDVICDPAAGTCGFLMAAAEYMREKHPGLLLNRKQRDHFHHDMFHGFDFDSTMLRIGSMNMLLHGVENADVRHRDSLAESSTSDAEHYSLILANPPFAGSLDYENVARDLQKIVKTKKTELLFIALFLRLLKPGGQAAVIVPDGVLFGSTKAHKELRRMLVEDHKLDAVIKLPSGAFKPYAGVSTAILLFTKTNSGGTNQVWFYEVIADGFSLDDKRTALLPETKLGPSPTEPLTDDEHIKNNLPDVVARWRRLPNERLRPRTAQSFCVPKQEIAEQNYDLSLNRYKEVEYEEDEHRIPGEIMDALEELEKEIHDGMVDLRGMLK
ncbi:MAG: N-6 DNA methylase [Pseudonocardiaceae bacterium]